MRFRAILAILAVFALGVSEVPAQVAPESAAKYNEGQDFVKKRRYSDAIAAFAGWAVAWSIPGIALAVAVCMAIAVGFGVYPAMSAARLDPVTALQAD